VTDADGPATAAVVKDDEHAVDIQLLLERLPGRWRRGAVHVGAHVGEEVPAYLSHGFERVVLIEPNPRPCLELRRRCASDPRVTIIEAAAAGAAGWLDFYVHTSRSGSVEAASVLPMKELKNIVKAMHTPRVLRVRGDTLDNLLLQHDFEPEQCDLLNLDVQGAEMLVLQGAKRVLAAAEWVISEINCLDLYEGGARETEIHRYLHEQGFRRDYTIYHRFYDEHGWFVAWGEALFCRTPRPTGEPQRS
jgi:FkbM family methyltransferase